MQVMEVFLDKGLMRIVAQTIRAIVAMVGEAMEIFSEVEEVIIGISQISTTGLWMLEIINSEVEEVKDMEEAMGAEQDF
jgi:diacylglycerol kinase